MVKTNEGVIFEEGFLPWKTLYEVRAMIGYLVTFLNLYDEVMRQDPPPIPSSSILPSSQRLARKLLHMTKESSIPSFEKVFGLI